MTDELESEVQVRVRQLNLCSPLIARDSWRCHQSPQELEDPDGVSPISLPIDVDQHKGGRRPLRSLFLL